MKKKPTKKLPTKSLKKKNNTPTKTRKRLTITAIVTSIVMGFMAYRLYKRGKTMAGTAMAVLAVFTLFMPFLMPSDASLFAGIAVMIGLIVPIIVLPMISIVNLISPNMAKNLL